MGQRDLTLQRIKSNKMTKPNLIQLMNEGMSHEERHEVDFIHHDSGKVKRSPCCWWWGYHE